MNSKIDLEADLSMHLDKLENIINQTYKYDKVDTFILKINQILLLKS